MTGNINRMVVAMTMIPMLSMAVTQLPADTITAEDLFTASGATGPGGNEGVDLGVDTITIGVASFKGFDNGTPSNLSYAVATAPGVGVFAHGGVPNSKRTNARRSVSGTNMIDIDFSLAADVSEIRIGRWGASDGSFKISGFGGDPLATASGGSTASYDGLSDTLTLTAPSSFGAVTVTFADATGIGSLSLMQVDPLNDGMSFESISFVPEPATLSLLALGGLGLLRRKQN